MTHLSETFKYISHFRHAGHQVGRKVGDMLEVLTYAALTRDTDLGCRLQIEPKLYGFCDAGHKVEFAILREPTANVKKGGEVRDPSVLCGFVECKKVGVEQTVRSSFKLRHLQQNYTFTEGQYFETTFAHHGRTRVDLRVSFHLTSAGMVETSVQQNGVEVLRKEVATGHRIMFAMTRTKVKILANDESLRDIKDTLLSCQILEFQRVEGGSVRILLNDCLPGPQTPEKAKQASFVALDVRKLRFGQFDKRTPETELVSVLVLTEFSHWEQKSQNMVLSCLDKVVVVPDELLISAFEQFEASFGANFYHLISKDNFEKHEQVRQIALDLLAKSQGKIFEDLADGRMKAISFRQGTLVFVN